MGGYHKKVSDYDYWGNTPLINKQWFINPGLTLNKMEISQALEALSFLSGEEKEVGRTRVGVGLSGAVFFRSSCGSGNGGNGPLELCLLVYDSGQFDSSSP